MVGPNWLSRRSRRLHRYAVAFLAVAIAFTACLKDRTPELLGAWQATMLIEEGDTIDVILDDVGLYFDAEGKYVYTSTLDYEEFGTFRTKGDMLFTTPGKQDTLIERPVAIAMLSENTLHLNMKEGEKNRILEFQRIDMNAIEVVEPDTAHEGHDHEDHDHSHDELLEVIDTTGLSEIDD